MKNSTTKTFDTANSNATLSVVFLELFRIRKLQNAKKTMFGFGNYFFRIIRHTDKNIYAYGFRIVFVGYRVLYSGKNKLKVLNSFSLTIIFLIVNLIWIPTITILFFPYRYLDGARNFIRDTAWYQNVRFFNWINFILIIILLTTILVKNYR